MFGLSNLSRKNKMAILAKLQKIFVIFDQEDNPLNFGKVFVIFAQEDIS